MLFSGIIIGLLIGLIWKGKISYLADLRLKTFYLIIISLVMQLLLLASPLAQFPWIIQNGALLYTISLDILLLGLMFNWRLGWSFRLIILGTLLNFIVIASNNGTIPVDLEKLSIVSNQSVVELKNQFEAHQELSYRHPLNDKSSLGFLGDVIYIPVPFLLDSNVYSLGDVCIALGLAWFVTGTMKGYYRQFAKAEQTTETNHLVSTTN
jgi:hypothetical protein